MNQILKWTSVILLAGLIGMSWAVEYVAGSWAEAPI